MTRPAGETAEEPAGRDAFDARRAAHAPPVLREFNDAGVLAAADVHVARRLARLGGEDDPAVLLGGALAARAPRLGHVRVDLATARHTVTAGEDPVDGRALPWPDADAWPARLRASPLVATETEDAGGRPLRLVGTRLYPERSWQDERRVAVELVRRSQSPAEAVDHGVLATGLARLFDGDAPELQRLAAAAAVLRRVAVVAGGPGTGKTTTVARILALLDEQVAAAGQPAPRVALTAPTGRAAVALQGAVHAEAAAMDVAAATRDRLLAAGADTLHRLLGSRAAGGRPFRHHRGNRLPHDVVVVDEASMLSLSLMTALVVALRDRARLVLVGDPDQLTSVEAGAVLGDLVGPAAGGLRLRPAARRTLASVTGRPVPAEEPPEGSAVGDGVVVLRRGHRYGEPVAALAEAVRRGDADAALTALRAGSEQVAWIDVDVAGTHDPAALDPVRSGVAAAGRRVSEAAHAGDADGALTALGAARVLCAHRRGPYGAAAWTRLVERWLVDAIPGYGQGGRWYVGRPLLVTGNDRTLRLSNGDTGVVVDDGGGGVRAVFARGDGVVRVSPARLAAAETAHATTVHKSQGSQFGEVTVVLPDASSPVLTRELLHTAVTRASARLTVVGPEASVRRAVTRPIARASGLREALWGDG